MKKWLGLVGMVLALYIGFIFGQSTIAVHCTDDNEFEVNGRTFICAPPEILAPQEVKPLLKHNTVI